MNDPTRHLGEQIQDLLDGRLDPAAEPEVRAHLAACGLCNDEFNRLSWLKGRLKALPPRIETPPDLEAMIRDALDREASDRPSDIVTGNHTGNHTDNVTAKPPERPTSPRDAWGARSWLTAAVAASVMLAIAGGLAAGWWFHAPRPAEVGRDYFSLAAGSLRLEHETRDPRDLQRYYAAHGGVPAGVYDLGMMQYTLVGGRVHAHRGQPGTLTLYEGTNGERLICEMYFAPPPSRDPVVRRIHNGIEFTVYRHEGVVMVFWDEGPVTCVLVAKMEIEALLRIAFAKAAPPS